MAEILELTNLEQALLGGAETSAFWPDNPPVLNNASCFREQFNIYAKTPWTLERSQETIPLAVRCGNYRFIEVGMSRVVITPLGQNFGLTTGGLDICTAIGMRLDLSDETIYCLGHFVSNPSQVFKQLLEILPNGFKITGLGISVTSSRVTAGFLERISEFRGIADVRQISNTEFGGMTVSNEGIVFSKQQTSRGLNLGFRPVNIHRW